MRHVNTVIVTRTSDCFPNTVYNEGPTPSAQIESELSVHVRRATTGQKIEYQPQAPRYYRGIIGIKSIVIKHAVLILH